MRKNSELNIEDWQFLVGDVQTQTDNFNCGVFVCRFFEICFQYKHYDEELNYALQNCFLKETPNEMRLRIKNEIKSALIKVEESK